MQTAVFVLRYNELWTAENVAKQEEADRKRREEAEQNEG